MEDAIETLIQYGALGAICVVLIINSQLDRRERQKDREERKAMWAELLQIAKDSSKGLAETITFLREKIK